MAKKAAIVLIVAVLGVCAALPFYRLNFAGPTSSDAAADPAPSLNWRNAPKRPIHIPLQVSAAADVPSPAASLASPGAANPDVGHPPQVQSPARLTAEPPPSLPENFSHPFADVDNPPANLEHRDLVGFDAPWNLGELRASRGAAPRRGAAGFRLHTITEGDTLSSLAIEYFGDAAREHDILAVNDELIEDPAALPVGRVIRIPVGGAVSVEHTTRPANGEMAPVPIEFFGPSF